MRTSFKVKGLLKVKVTKSANAQTGSASYLLNGKAYELDSYGERRPVSPASAI